MLRNGFPMLLVVLVAFQLFFDGFPMKLKCDVLPHYYTSTPALHWYYTTAAKVISDNLATFLESRKGVAVVISPLSMSTTH